MSSSSSSSSSSTKELIDTKEFLSVTPKAMAHFCAIKKINNIISRLFRESEIEGMGIGFNRSPDVSTEELTKEGLLLRVRRGKSVDLISPWGSNVGPCFMQLYSKKNSYENNLDDAKRWEALLTKLFTLISVKPYSVKPYGEDSDKDNGCTYYQVLAVEDIKLPAVVLYENTPGKIWDAMKNTYGNETKFELISGRDKQYFYAIKNIHTRLEKLIKETTTDLGDYKFPKISDLDVDPFDCQTIEGLELRVYPDVSIESGSIKSEYVLLTPYGALTLVNFSDDYENNWKNIWTELIKLLDVETKHEKSDDFCDVTVYDGNFSKPVFWYEVISKVWQDLEAEYQKMQKK